MHSLFENRLSGKLTTRGVRGHLSPSLIYPDVLSPPSWQFGADSPHISAGFQQGEAIWSYSTYLNQCKNPFFTFIFIKESRPLELYATREYGKRSTCGAPSILYFPVHLCPRFLAECAQRHHSSLPDLPEACRFR